MTTKVAKNWTARLREQGVTFIENCRLEGMEKSDGKISQLQTSNGPLTADQFVFATGAKMAQLAKQLGCRIPIQPGKGYSLTMARPAICPKVPMLFPEHKVGVTPFDGAYRLGSMMEFSGYDDSIRPQRMQQLRTSAEPYLRDPHTDAVEEEWYGWRPMTWDGKPIIDRSPALENVWIAAGHSMLGLSMATGTGKLIADLVGGTQAPIDPVPYSVARFL